MMLCLVCGHIVMKSYNSIRYVYVVFVTLACYQCGSTTADCQQHGRRSDQERLLHQSQFCKSEWSWRLPCTVFVLFYFFHLLLLFKMNLNMYWKHGESGFPCLSHTHTHTCHTEQLRFNTLLSLRHTLKLRQNSKLQREEVVRWCIFPIELT